MPHKNLKINSKAIDRANRVQEQITQAMRGVQRLDTYKYSDRDLYYGKNSPYRYKPNPAYKMPGTSPPDKKRTVADVILEFLKIKPKKRIRKERPVRKGGQDKYRGLI